MAKATASDDTTKTAAMYLLRNGLASVAEITALSGRSRQIVRHWAKEHPDARADRLAKLWSRAMVRAKNQ